MTATPNEPIFNRSTLEHDALRETHKPNANQLRVDSKRLKNQPQIQLRLSRAPVGRVERKRNQTETESQTQLSSNGRQRRSSLNGEEEDRITNIKEISLLQSLSELASSSASASASASAAHAQFLVSSSVWPNWQRFQS